MMTACTLLDGVGHRPGTPGYISKGESQYDGKRFVMLQPASLFDLDNTPSVFRIGLLWDERYADDLQIIVAFPLGEITSTSELASRTEALKINIDGKNISLKRVQGSIMIKEDNTLIKEHEANIKYEINKKMIKSMIAAKQVLFRLDTASKVYDGNLHLQDNKQNHYTNAYYTAENAIKRFYDEVWGQKSKQN